MDNNKKKMRIRYRLKKRNHSSLPRLSVHLTNKHTYVQIIDDCKASTIAFISSVGKDLKGYNKEGAREIGFLIGKKALEANIKQVVFDRGSKKYHGRIAELANAARETGLII